MRENPYPPPGPPVLSHLTSNINLRSKPNKQREKKFLHFITKCSIINKKLTQKNRLEWNITNPYWITIKHPEVDIMHQSRMIKTKETASILKKRDYSLL